MIGNILGTLRLLELLFDHIHLGLLALTPSPSPKIGRGE
jgi:hypothetical protein